MAYFWTYRLWKTWLGKFLNSPVSEHPSKANMSKRTKDLSNLHDSTFIIFSEHFEQNRLGKYLC